MEIEQIHCVLTDELKNDAIAVCKRIYNLIGIREDFEPLVERQYNQAAMPRSDKFSYLFTQFLASQNPLRRAIRKLVPSKATHKIRKTILDLNEKPFTPPPIKPNTHQELVNYLKPHNDQLAELLEQDLSHWNTLKEPI